MLCGMGFALLCKRDLKLYYSTEGLMKSHHTFCIVDGHTSKKEKAHRLICIGLDLSFVNQILTESDNASFLLDICKNLQVAREKISSSSLYDLYIIDSSLLKEPIAAFVEDIRKKETKRSIIAIVSDRAEEYYRQMLQEEKSIDYIIQKQNIEKDIEFMFKNINEGEAHKYLPLQESSKIHIFPVVGKSSLTSKLSLAHKPLLFVVDDDPHFLELLERIKQLFWIELIVESDPHRAIEKLQSPEFNPQSIIVSQKFRSSSVTGLDLLMVQEKKKNPFTVILLEKESLEDRLQAIEKGVDYTFCKPVSACALLKTMVELMEVDTIPGKVLIVDDDANFCHYIGAALEDVGISTCAIHEPTELYDKLEEFKPNILLLNIELPKCNGLHLVEILRHDIKYKNLVIVITGNEDMKATVDAYKATVDYILFKPVDYQILQKCILNITKLRLSAKELTHNYTGLFQIQELQQELTTALKNSNQQSFSLALFEVDEFFLWTEKHGHASARELLIFIGNQLQWEMDDQMQCFWYKEGQFAILFEELGLDMVQNRMYQFLTDIIKKQQKTTLSFNCSIVSISKNFSHELQILEAVETTLNEARKKHGTSLVRITSHEQQQDEWDRKREVVIVDSDRDLLRMLKQAFESHGITVKTYHEGTDALKDLLLRDESRLPALIILERKLSDMDGIDVCHKLKNRFRTAIPFFMLTVFSADKDISDGLKNNVSEYIVKPFNISLLIQKALQVIFIEKHLKRYAS